MALDKLSFLLILSLLISSSSLASACGSCNPIPKPAPSPKLPHCPKDTLKLGVCLDILGLINLQLGTPPSPKCCELIKGLADLEAALCLCTAIKAKVLGINLNVPLTLSLLLSACQKSVPPGFQCA